MMSTLTIEQMFANDYRKFLKEELETRRIYISESPLSKEEYLVNVGQVQALKLVDETFESYMKIYFARE